MARKKINTFAESESTSEEEKKEDNGREKFYDLLRKTELKKQAEKWDRLSHNIKNTSAEKINILPDMLWISNKGVNKTHLLYLLSEYVSGETNLMKFRGRIKFVEFNLGYNDGKEESFAELVRLDEAVYYSAGYRDCFKGMVYVDISDWVGHINRHFYSFLEYLASNTNNWLIILNINDTASKEEIQALETSISTYLRIETIKFSHPGVDIFLEYAETELASYNFQIDDSARKLLVESFKKLKSNKNFDGYNTIRNFCADIIYEALSKENCVYFLTAKDLEGFSSGSEYVSRMIEKGKERKIIGF